MKVFWIWAFIHPKWPQSGSKVTPEGFQSAPKSPTLRIRAYLRYIEPEGRKPSALDQNRDTTSLFEKLYVSVRIRVYLRYIEPEGRKPSTLYQNPGTINPFHKTIHLHSN